MVEAPGVESAFSSANTRNDVQPLALGAAENGIARHRGLKADDIPMPSEQAPALVEAVLATIANASPDVQQQVLHATLAALSGRRA